MAESVTFKNFIGGKWVPAESGETFQNINPADREDIIGEFPASGPADVEKAVEAAKKAFITTRIGDVGLLIGIILLWKATGSFDIQTIIAAATSGQIGETYLTVAMIACLGVL